MNTNDPVLNAIRTAHLDVERANAALEQAVATARASGATWQMIGEALNVSKQAAAKRFSERTAQLYDVSPEIHKELQLIVETVFSALRQQDYDHLHSLMTYVTARLLSKRKISKVWNQVVAELGEFIAVKKTVVEKGVNKFILTYRLQHEHGEPVGQIVFNSARKITGLVIFYDDTAELPW